MRATIPRFLAALLSFFFLAPAVLHADSTVGLPARIDELVLPGTELEVKPLDDRKVPIVLRIVRVSPHGTAFRYDLEYYGLEAGTFDLKDHLRRKDRSLVADLPAIPVTVRSVLPPGQVKPHDLESRRSPWLGGYRILLMAAATVWAIGFVALLFWGRRKLAASHIAARPVTLADHLLPLIEGARAGRLSPASLAELERTLIAYWTRRLHLEGRKPAEALEAMRGHAEAGPLLGQLEAWLHRPGPSGDVDVAALLEPYRTIPAEDLEGAASRP
jgi:hypothetical protein